MKVDKASVTILQPDKNKTKIFSLYECTEKGTGIVVGRKRDHATGYIVVDQ